MTNPKRWNLGALPLGVPITPVLQLAIHPAGDETFELVLATANSEVVLGRFDAQNTSASSLDGLSSVDKSFTLSKEGAASLFLRWLPYGIASQSLALKGSATAKAIGDDGSSDPTPAASSPGGCASPGLLPGALSLLGLLALHRRRAGR